MGFAEMFNGFNAFDKEIPAPNASATEASTVTKPGAIYSAKDKTILGMTPETFSSAAGQLAQTFVNSPTRWQNKLGGVAAQMGNMKMLQLAQAEKEKRMSEILKQIFGQTTHADIAKFADQNHPLGLTSLDSLADKKPSLMKDIKGLDWTGKGIS